METYQWEAISPVRRDRMLDAENAVEAVTTAARESFFGWLRVGAGLYDMQHAVMELSGSSTPYGRAYTAAYKAVATRVPKLAEIDPATRSHAIWLYENREAVEAWHAGLDDNVKRLVNHPRSCRRRYEHDQQLTAEETQPPPTRPKARSDAPAEEREEVHPRGAPRAAALDQSTEEVRRGAVEDAVPEAIPEAEPIADLVQKLGALSPEEDEEDEEEEAEPDFIEGYVVGYYEGAYQQAKQPKRTPIDRLAAKFSDRDVTQIVTDLSGYVEGLTEASLERRGTPASIAKSLCLSVKQVQQVIERIKGIGGNQGARPGRS